MTAVSTIAHTHMPKPAIEATVTQLVHPDILPPNCVSLSEPDIASPIIFMTSANTLMMYANVRPALKTPTAKPNQNFHASLLYVYSQVHQLKETASRTAIILFLRRVGCPTPAPQAGQYIAWSGNSFPHLVQKLTASMLFLYVLVDCPAHSSITFIV